MKSPEGQERFLGVRIEYPQTNKASVVILAIASGLYRLFSRLQIEGELPQNGPALVIANHTSMTDIFKMAYVSYATSRRLIRAVAKESLLNLSIKDSEETLIRTGKKGKFDVLKLPVVKNVVAYTINGVGAISLTRGEPNKAFATSCDAVLADEEMLGMFAQDTRVKEGDLNGVMPGIGVLARKHRDTSIVPVSIWASKFGSRVIVGEKTTYNRLAEEVGYQPRSRETTALIMDKVAQNLPSPLRVKWQEIDRPLFLTSK